MVKFEGIEGSGVGLELGLGGGSFLTFWGRVRDLSYNL